MLLLVVILLLVMQPPDSISAIAGIPSNLVPEGDGVYDLGIPPTDGAKHI